MVIHLPTAEEREDILRRRYRVRRPEHRRAMYIGGGGVSIPGDASVLNAFNGSFAALFPGAYQVVQSDLGLTYGGTTLAAGTTPPAGTLSGTLATPPVPILFKCTTAGVVGSGAVFSASYDGGATNAMTNITPTAGTPVALVGAASGLSHAWAAGTAALDNTWTATCAGLADQSGNGKDYSQATPSLQPILSPGPNGKPEILFDGLDDLLDCAALNMPAPALTPWSCFCVFRLKTFATFTNPRILSSISASTVILAGNNGVPGTFMFAGNVVNGVSKPVSSAIYYAIDMSFTNSTADYLRVGNTAAATGANAGSAAPTGRRVGGGGATFSNVGLVMLAYTPPQSATAWRSAVLSAAGYGSVGVEA